MSGSNLHQPLIDTIDIILRKNYVTQNNDFSIHLTELPSLPQNRIGLEELKKYLSKLNIKLIGSVAGTLNIKKLGSEDEERLLTEKQSLKDNNKSNNAEKQISLKTASVTFNDEKSSIETDSRICSLPPFQNEHFFCRAMFKHKIDEPIDWSLIYQEMTGSEESIGDNKNKRTVQDTMYAINNRIKADFNTSDNLFSWKNKSIKRNF